MSTRWQTVTQGRKKKTVNGSRQVEAIEEEIRAAIFSRPQTAPAVQRHPEWRCGQCSTSNWIDRPVCQCCGTGRLGASKCANRVVPRVRSPSSLPAGPAWANRREPTASSRASALEQAAAAERRAGVPIEAASAVAAEAAATKRAATEAKPPSERLDRLRERLERAESKRAAAQEKSERALERLDQAAQHVDLVRRELADFEAGLSQQAPDVAPINALHLAGQRLLDRWENFAWRSSSGVRAEPPTDVLEAMRELHAAHAAAAPPVALSLDEALEPGPLADISASAVEPSSDRQEPVVTEPPSEPIVVAASRSGDPGQEAAVAIADLMDVADEDEDALLAAARRLKRARASA